MTNTEHPPNAQRLPPGMVIGPDGKPCKICTAFRNWNPTKAKEASSSKTKKGSDDASFAAMAGGTMAALASGSGSQAPTSTTSTPPDGPPKGCPPDVEQLGRSTWTFLHTTAAYYPADPSKEHRARMLGLLFALPILYPCSWCAMHLGQEIQRTPPDVSTRERLSRWLCEQHNRVNERLGKPLFDCSIKNLDERWKDGPSDGRCD